MLVLMSHGTRNDEIFDSNNHRVKLSDLHELLSPKYFPAMEGKPKVTIVQACSGGELFFILLTLCGFPA